MAVLLRDGVIVRLFVGDGVIVTVAVLLWDGVIVRLFVGDEVIVGLLVSDGVADGVTVELLFDDVVAVIVALLEPVADSEGVTVAVTKPRAVMDDVTDVVCVCVILAGVVFDVLVWLPFVLARDGEMVTVDGTVVPDALEAGGYTLLPVDNAVGVAPLVRIVDVLSVTELLDGLCEGGFTTPIVATLAPTSYSVISRPQQILSKPSPKAQVW